MRIAVVGGTGFLGRHVVEHLRGAGHAVTVFARGDRPSNDGSMQVCNAIRPIDSTLFEDVDAVVNLVGIKRERGENTFEAAHVGAVENIIAAMRASETRRLVHISVCGAAASDDPYLDTKHRGERRVIESGLDYTVLRPAVVYGSGDDMMHNLVATLRHMAIFPAPNGGRARLAVVDVEDVALAVLRALERPETSGKSHDIVGPEQPSLRELIGRVGDAIGLPAWALPAPLPLLRPAAAVLESVMGDPPVTRAQLGMLGRGMTGDPSAARDELGLEPRALDEDRIRELANEPRNLVPLFGISLRTIFLPAHRVLLERAGRAGNVYLRMLIGVVCLSAATFVFDSAWAQVIAGSLVMLALNPGLLRLPWNSLLRIDLRVVLVGIAAALLLAGAGAIGHAGLSALFPWVAEQTTEVYGWADAISFWIAFPVIAIIVAIEEVYWRIGIGLPLAARHGPWVGILGSGLTFAAAHALIGPPTLVIAALLCGAFWTWLAIRTRSIVAPYLAHLGWDALVLWVWPYG